ncbi:MAG: NUDIX domain-containing protein [Armatimonadota bacterium]
MTKNLQERVIGSQIAFQGRLLSVRVDTVRLSSGGTSTREVVAHPGAVTMIPLLGEKVLFVRQWRNAAEQALLEIPAGTLSPGEDPRDCAARELMEEIGYRPGKLTHLCSFFLAPGYSTEKLHVFLAEELTPEKQPHDEDEVLEVVALTWPEIDERLLHGEFADAKTIAGLLMAKNQLHSR